MFLTLFLSLNFQIKGQELITADLDYLGPGEEIFDVEFLPFASSYVLVGSFSHTAGTDTWDNVIYLNSNLDIITSLTALDDVSPNGPVYSVDSYRYGTTNAIYFGGNFTQMGLTARNCTGRIDIVDNGTSATSGTFSTWDADLDVGPVYKVLNPVPGRINIGGDFNIVYNSSSTQTRQRVASFTSGAGNLSSVITNVNNSTYAPYDMDYISSKFYYCNEGPGGGLIQSSWSATENTGLPVNGTFGHQLYDLNDSLMVLLYNHAGGGGYGPQLKTVVRKSDLSEKHDHPYSNINLPGFTPNAICHNEYLYKLHNNTLYTYDHEIGSSPINTINFTVNSGTILDYEDIGLGNYISNLHVENNTLFVSYPNMATADGQPRTGLAAFCLPPDRPQDFTAFDSTVCHGESVLFEIPVVDYAEGYLWTYSGTGVSVVGGFTEDLQDFSNFNSATINILDNFTAGVLTVTPYTECGNLTGGTLVYGKSKSINIHLNPLPNINLTNDTTLTCYLDTIQLLASSDTIGVSYEWQQLNAPFATFTGPNYTIWEANDYEVTVTAPSGCLNRDTVIVLENQTPPTIDSVDNWELGCNDSAFYYGYVSGSSDTLNWWVELASTDSLGNPALIYTSELGQWRFYSMDTINGCADSVTIMVEDKIYYPDFLMAGYGVVSSSTDLDTINCLNNPIVLTASADTTNTIVNWVDSNYENPTGDTYSVTNGGLYYLHAFNTDNNCENTIAFNIAEDFSEPLITLGSYGAINCSVDSVTLTGSSATPDTTLIWSGGSIAPTPPPVTIGNGGTYHLTVTKNSNGCSVTDSVLIVQDNSIDVIVSNDTSVCDQYPVNVSASYLGNINNITYLWSNGNTTSSANYTAGDDSLAIVEVNGDGGCFGTDTVHIETPPYPAINFQGFQPCGSGNTGSIVATPISGWFPFEYSIDNGVSYQTSNTIDGLDFGTYSIYVKDSLDCEYLFQATIDETSGVATPLFLFSTYNAQADTVRVIDVSSPAPDSIEWVVSPEIIILEANDSSALLHLPDTGEFSITMDAYFGTCLNSLTKTIHVSELDPNDATLFNANGIDTVYADPNPTTGVLNIGVELFSEQDVQIQIVDMSSYIHHEQLFSDTDYIQFSFTFPAAASPGTYIIRVIGEFDAAFKEIILTE